MEESRDREHELDALAGRDRDWPVSVRALIGQARLWAALHPWASPEVRDHLALRVAEEIGASI